MISINKQYIQAHLEFKAFWIRIPSNGPGIWGASYKRCRALFSERNGYKKVYKVPWIPFRFSKLESVEPAKICSNCAFRITHLNNFKNICANIKSGNFQKLMSDNDSCKEFKIVD